MVQCSIATWTIQPSNPPIFPEDRGLTLLIRDSHSHTIIMTTTTRRPVHLNLFQIRLPIPGILSIMHRATGVFMALAAPYLIYLLDQSLTNAAGYDAAVSALHSLPGVLFVFVLMWSISHHLLAGIRYLLIDVDVGVEKPLTRQTALGVIIAAPVLGLILTGGVL